MKYFGSRISDNLSRTPEGYLVAHGVPISRTGWFDYSPQELEVDSDKPVVRVYRSPEDLFSPATMASFEGKSVTDGHPPEDVTAENFGAYDKGHIQNVRKGEPLDSGETPLIADLVIKDKALIDRVEPPDGQREVSIGYKHRIVPRPDGNYDAIGTKGNHLASVPKGRAGHEVRIRDAAPTNPTTKRKSTNMAQTSTNKKTIFGKMLKALAGTDAEPEELAEAAKMGEEMKDAAPAVEAPGDPFEARMTKLEDAVTKLCDSYEADKKARDEEAAKTKQGEQEQDEDPDLIEEEEAVAGDAGELPESERPKNPLGDEFRSSLIAMKSAVASSKDKRAIDSYNHLLRSTAKTGNGQDGYKAIARVASTRSNDHERAAQDAATQRQNDLNTILTEARAKASAAYGAK